MYAAVTWCPWPRGDTSDYACTSALWLGLLCEGDEIENPGGDTLRRLELDVVAGAVDELEVRPRNRPGESPRGHGRHHVALGAGHHVGGASDAWEKRERVDRLGGEHAAVPAKPPPAFDLFDRALGEKL
jgi:hypothetical protein